MNRQHELTSKLKESGNKLTKLRLVFVDYFCQEHKPTSVEELTDYLESVGLSPNKTSIYRELDFLLSENVIQEVNLDDRKARYEFKNDGYHHHHLVCNVCKHITDIECPGIIKDQEKIMAQYGFVSGHHLLEFFGVCKNCQIGDKR